MKKHQKGVELHEDKKYTRSTSKQSQTEQNKPAITDHVNIEHHIIDWEAVTVLGWESHRTTRWIREAVKIRQEGQDVMNRDDGVLSADPRLRRLTTLHGYNCSDS